MKAFVNRTAAALTFGAFAAAPLVAQNATQACDPTANTKGDIAKAQFSLTRALASADKGDPTKNLQDVIHLTENGDDNPTARSFLRGEAYVIYMMRPNTPSVVQRSALGFNTNP